MKFFLTQVLSKLKLIDNQGKSSHSRPTIEEKTDSSSDFDRDLSGTVYQAKWDCNVSHAQAQSWGTEGQSRKKLCQRFSERVKNCLEYVDNQEST